MLTSEAKSFPAIVVLVFFTCADTSLAFLPVPNASFCPCRGSVDGSELQQENPNKTNEIRGSKYNRSDSSIPSPEVVAQRLNIRPTRQASKKTWLRAMKIHKRLLPLLHSLDQCKPADSSLNLACLWWKALAGSDKSSPVYDEGLSYDLLPSGFRNILKLRKLYPRLHHANVELRTAYLDNAIEDIVKGIDGEKKIQLICMGAGYDLRGIKMLERKLVDDVVELDLMEVVDAKKRLFGRLVRRRPWLNAAKNDSNEGGLPTLVPSDFNNIQDVKEKLRKVIMGRSSSTRDTNEWHTIFTFEGVMIYLDDGVPSALLEVASDVLKDGIVDGSLVLADRLENVPGGDKDLGIKELESGGWTLKDWCPKPGLARHMLSAELA